MYAYNSAWTPHGQIMRNRISSDTLSGSSSLGSQNFLDITTGAFCLVNNSYSFPPEVALVALLKDYEKGKEGVRLSSRQPVLPSCLRMTTF